MVLVGAFLDGDNGFTLANVQALTSPAVLRALRNSVVLSAVTAFAGAVIGGILAYAVSTAKASSVTKRFVTSLCGVLAQFGGVALAFAFVASFGMTGLITAWLNDVGVDTGTGFWLYGWNQGLMLVYLYFQVPLMVIVFLPAVEGLRPQWREATETLAARPGRSGAGSPARSCCRRSWVRCCCSSPTRSRPTPPRRPSSRRARPCCRWDRRHDGSEVILGQENVGKAMALAMIVVVALVMTAYVFLDRRASRWMQR